MSDADFDPRHIRLGRKFGLRGIGFYWSVLSRIAFRLSPEEPIPDLEETARDIAEFYGEDTLLIEEIMKWCVDEKLFQINPKNKRIVCLKLLMYLDNTMSNNPEIKKIINNFKKLEETSSGLKQIRLDKIRLDKTRLDKYNIPTISEISEYCAVKSYTDIDPEYFWNYYQARGWKYKTGQPMKDWKAAIQTWRKNNKSKNRPLDTTESRAERAEELRKIAEGEI